MIKSGEKKQVRRRLHTSRPYQERLLNMAEARREIVTALKYHRASMKQQQIQQANSSQFDHPPPPAPFYWPPPVTEDFPLPNQTLGLNLNFHDFDTPTVTVCVNACEEVQSISTSKSYGGDDHDVMMMMAEIRSIGDQHEMEWNDHKMNLVTSAWWFNPDEEHFDEYCSTQEDYFQHPVLPSYVTLDIGEIEDLEDEEWLS